MRLDNGGKTIQSFLDRRVQNYVGHSVADLKHQFGYQGDGKANFAVLARRMLNISNQDHLDLATSGDFCVKTVRVTGAENPAEPMVFQEIDFDEWCSDLAWHQTKTYRFFASTYLALVVYQQYPAGQRVADSDILFQGVHVVKIPDYDLEHGIQDLRNEVRRLVTTGQFKVTETVNSKGKVIRHNNFPGIKFNGVAHIRPGGVNGDDLVTLPSGQQVSVQRFWLNSGYIKKLLGEY